MRRSVAARLGGVASPVARRLGSPRAKRIQRTLRWSLVVLGLLMVASAVAFAQAAPGDMPRSITTAYRNSRAPAIAVFNQYAGGLFRALALVEMAWAAVILLLERSDLQSWMAGFLRKFLVLFAFLYLLQNGADFSDRIMSSFTTIGTQAAGLPAGASPGDVFFEGATIAGNLLSKADFTGFLINPAPAVMVILAALIVFISFVVVSIHYIMAQVESYIVVSAGLIFLGFGGNSITRPYVERFFALAVAVGVKLMIILMIVGIGRNLTAQWAAIADGISLVVFPVQDVLDLIGGSLIFAAIAWGVPKFAASLLAGSPSFTGSDIISMGMSTVNAGLMVAGGAALATRGAAVLAGGASGGSGSIASAAAAGNGSSGPGSAGRGGPGSGPSGSGGSNGNGSGSGGPANGTGPYAPAQPAPPGNASSSANGSSSTNSAPASGTSDGSPPPGAAKAPVHQTAEPGSAPAGMNASSPSASAQSPSAPQGAPPAAGPATPPAAPTAATAPSAVSSDAPSATGAGNRAQSREGGPNGPVARPHPVGKQGSGPPPNAPTPQPADSPVANASQMAPAVERPANQVPPPGFPEKSTAQKVEEFAAGAQRAVQQAAMVAFFAARILPPEGAPGGAPPTLNMHGE